MANYSVVIPAEAGIQLRNTGFRVKPGMTSKGKGFMTLRRIDFPEHL